ncbi:Conserved_hypothetical protein [Hexamita inflata]|uniref:Transmembrane protein n=1 Tax=Hexamita inflata TaxID=28002 RepID=A0AA86PCQ3_9EUKA|nr:Conserved hypothetical protein [Hexamita inflata]CAI9973522.1 Conserved hypothetical protein [Hexamita inflata]
MYALGLEQNCIQLSKIYSQVDAEMHQFGYIMSFSFTQDLKYKMYNSFLNAFKQNSFTVSLDNVYKDNINIQQRVYLQACTHVQQMIRGAWQSIAAFAHNNIIQISDEMKNSKYFAPIQYILSYDQDVLKDQLDSGKSPTNTQMSPSEYGGIQIINGLIYFANKTATFAQTILNSYNLRESSINLIYHSFIQLDLHFEDQYNRTKVYFNKHYKSDLVRQIYITTLMLLSGLFIYYQFKQYMDYVNFEAIHIKEDAHALRFVKQKLYLSKFRLLIAIGEAVVLIILFILSIGSQQLNRQVNNIKINYENSILQLNNALGAFSCSNNVSCIYLQTSKQYLEEAIYNLNRDNSDYQQLQESSYFQLMQNAALRQSYNIQNKNANSLNYITSLFSSSILDKFLIIPKNNTQTESSQYIQQLSSNNSTQKTIFLRYNNILYTLQDYSSYDNKTQYYLIQKTLQVHQEFIKKCQDFIEAQNSKIYHLSLSITIPLVILVALFETMAMIQAGSVTHYMHFITKLIKRIHREEFDKFPPQIVISL